MNMNTTSEDNADVFEIHTESFTVAKFAEMKQEFMKTLERQKSIVLNISNVSKMENEVETELIEFHALAYQEYNLSFVLVDHTAKISTEGAELLNVCPTPIEALEIVNMEVIEREFLADEE